MSLKKFAFVLVALFLVACGDDESGEFLTRPKADASDISSSSSDRSSSSSAGSSSSSSTVSSSSVSAEYVEPCRGEGYDDCEYDTLIDERDGQSYKTVKIGKMWWMAENLNFAYLQPTEKEDSSSFCYDNILSNCERYGRLYLWSAAMDSAALYSDDGVGCGDRHLCEPASTVQGVCPRGWHVPSRTDFVRLYETVGGAKTSMMTVDDWEKCGAQCTDSYGFSVLPAGYIDDGYEELGFNALFWSSTPLDSASQTHSAYYLYVNFYMGFGSSDEDDADHAYSVRCMKDED